MRPGICFGASRPRSPGPDRRSKSSRWIMEGWGERPGITTVGERLHQHLNNSSGRHRPSGDTLMKTIIRTWVFLVVVMFPAAPLFGDEKEKSKPVVVELVGAVARPGGGDPLGVAVADKCAYVCAHQDGLRIVDVTDPRKPREISTFHTIGRTRDVSIQGKYAFLANQ